jgi:hypothetical protein
VLAYKRHQPRSQRHRLDADGACGTEHFRNWSGYVVTAGPYTGVTGVRTVPQPNVTGGTGIGATWVGIGGVSSRDLIQAGTQDATRGGGRAQFEAWIEMLPQPSQQVPLAVAPGDSVTVAIDELGAGTGNWQISDGEQHVGADVPDRRQLYVLQLFSRMDRRGALWAGWNRTAGQLQFGLV